MRIVSAGVSAAFLVASTLGTAASPAVPNHDVKNGSALELIKSTQSSAHRSHNRGTRVSHRAGGTRTAAGARPGGCGTGKYYSKGQCVSAADKKSTSWSAF